jgi:hypothetical protein
MQLHSTLSVSVGVKLLFPSRCAQLCWDLAGLVCANAEAAVSLCPQWKMLEMSILGLPCAQMTVCARVLGSSVHVLICMYVFTWGNVYMCIDACGYIQMSIFPHRHVIMCLWVFPCTWVHADVVETVRKEDCWL